MHKPQEQVRQFRRDVLKQSVSPSYPMIRDAVERARFIAEEAAETMAALVGGAAAKQMLSELAQTPLDTDVDGDGKPFKRVLRAKPDLVEVIDGVCDGIFVYYGVAEAIGIDLEPYYDAVWKSNMEKTGALRDENMPDGPRGKKPPGWQPPTGAIRRQLLADKATISSAEFLKKGDVDVD